MNQSDINVINSSTLHSRRLWLFKINKMTYCLVSPEGNTLNILVEYQAALLLTYKYVLIFLE